MAKQHCSKCKWIQKGDDTQNYRLCPECGFDAQDISADVLPIVSSIGEEDNISICPICGKERMIYGETAHCFHCNTDFDLGMRKYKK